MSGKYTKKLLEMLDTGVIPAEWLAKAFVMWCGEENISEFYERLPDEFYGGCLEDDGEDDVAIP